MSINKKECRIKIIKHGPYLVSGNVPLSEKIIVPEGKGYRLKEGRALPQDDVYALCRCGKSKNAPFCDGTHISTGFIGDETASKDKYEDRAELQEGPALDLWDDSRCAFGRFCHREKGKVWQLAECSDDADNRSEAIQAAGDCPSGRLVAMDKTGKKFEPDYDPAIDIIQDPENHVSAGIYVKGYIPIESADGQLYEVRNRAALCRCGNSRNKPFCDATHVPLEFSDSQKGS